MHGWKYIPWALPFPLGSLPGLSLSPHPAQASRPPHMQRSVNVARGGRENLGGGWVHCEAKKVAESSDAAQSHSPPIRVNPG